MRSGPLRRRVLAGLRLGLLAGALAAAVAAGGRLAQTLGVAPVLGSTWLTATLGPTAYLLLAHPHHAQARRRAATLGHLAGVGAGLAALAVFGLWDAPSSLENPDGPAVRIAAQALALGATLLVLTVLDAHHAPAGATALLVASGIARPGPMLAGLAVGLVIVLVLAPLLARVPGGREDVAELET